MDSGALCLRCSASKGHVDLKPKAIYSILPIVNKCIYSLILILLYTFKYCHIIDPISPSNVGFTFPIFNIHFDYFNFLL